MHTESSSSVSIYARIRPAPRRSGKGPLVSCDGDYLTFPTDLYADCRTRHVRFDRVFNPAATNADVSSELLSRTAVHGGVNGDGPKMLIMAYGHTGSGKTHSVFGGDSTPGDHGLTGPLLKMVLDECKRSKHELTISVLEVYKEKVYDLLSPTCSRTTIRCAADGVRACPRDPHDALKMLRSGLLNRVVGQNAANHRSSRSHTLVIMYIDGVQRITVVDLAGAERWCTFGPLAHDKRPDSRDEMTSINKSLTSLAMLLAAFFVEPPSCVHVLVCIAEDVTGEQSERARRTLLTDTQRSIRFASTIKKTVSFIRTVGGTGTKKSHHQKDRSTSLPPSTARGRPIVSREEHEDLKEAVASLRCELDKERARRLKLETMVKVQQSRERSDGEQADFCNDPGSTSRYALLADPAVLTTQPPLGLFLHDCFDWTTTIHPRGGIGPPPRTATHDPWATPLRPDRCRASSQVVLMRRSSFLPVTKRSGFFALAEEVEAPVRVHLLGPVERTE
ncbi:hypothetical protein FOZ62_022362 [Perkinsus olseni]|uniref:Kinesin motor domain-containing protein n=1 Tax=Perkinsus olseni TaxID=32597 RepID=A0A7J6TA27_PEROL|nr:hypothetical protein FOZ62_022362 [Perkinsus olseni]